MDRIEEKKMRNYYSNVRNVPLNRGGKGHEKKREKMTVQEYSNK
jgi:hypothetical protein